MNPIMRFSCILVALIFPFTFLTMMHDYVSPEFAYACGLCLMWSVLRMRQSRSND